MPQPPEVLFAQKAIAIVKAAGLDPKNIDLDTFRKWAPIIFTRAYTAIYKEELISEVGEFSSKEEKILNSQLVIDGLTAKTRNTALATISGIDIYQGNQRAIGILVGVLFNEGQRMWLEKSKSKGIEEAKFSGNKQKNNTAPDVTNYRTQEAPIMYDIPNSPESMDYDTMMNERQSLRLIQNHSNISPIELERLLNRISYLESRLKQKSKKPSAHKARPNSASRAQSISPRKNSPDAKSPSRLSKSPRSSRSQEGEGMNHKVDNANDLSDDEQNINDENRRPKSADATKRVRPSSASGVRRVKNVSSRLYSTPMNRAMIEAVTRVADPSPPPKPYVAPIDPLYTYDLKSGRKILLAEAQIRKEEEERRKNAINNMKKAVTKEDDDYMGVNKGDGDRPLAGPQYPCERIEKSVEEWLDKKRKERIPAEKKVIVLEPKVFNVYEKMESLDFLISIEHCHNCEHHNVSTRHDPAEYRRNADVFLRILAECTMEAGICIRLGVSRFEANITPKSKASDDDSRIGAFEVQVACRSPSGEIITEVLHSKLKARRWPSKSVLEKRLKAFAAKTKAPTYYYSSEMVTTYEMCSDAGQSYPVGRCTFTETAMADDSWSYSSFMNSGSSSSIMYVFDSRSLHNQPKFTVGATVFVKNVNYESDCVEKYVLQGVVKRYEESSGGKHRYLFVRLRYHSDEIRVNETDCIGISEASTPLPSIVHEKGKLPFDFEAILLHGRKLDLINWETNENEDEYNSTTNETFLTRSSFFHQVRSLSWSVIKQLKAKGIATITHPLKGRMIDPFLCYSDQMLDKLSEVYGQKIDIQRMMKDLPVEFRENTSPRLSTLSSPRQSMAQQSNAVSPRLTSIGAPSHSVASPISQPDTTILSSNAKQTPASPRPSTIAVASVENTSSSKEPSAAVTPSSSRSSRPTVARPSMMSAAPSAEVMDKLHAAILQSVALPSELSGKYDKPINGLVEALSNDSNDQREISIGKMILLLDEFGLEAITDEAQNMRSLKGSFSATQEPNSNIKVDKLIEWLLKSAAEDNGNKTAVKSPLEGAGKDAAPKDVKIAALEVESSATNSAAPSSVSTTRAVGAVDAAIAAANVDERVKILKIACSDVSNVEVLGKNDVFVKLSYEQQVFETRVVHEAGATAVFDGLDFEFTVKGAVGDLLVEVWDKNNFKSNKLIGSARSSIRPLFIGNGAKLELSVAAGEDKTPSGKVLIFSSLQNVTNEEKSSPRPAAPVPVLESKVHPGTELSTKENKTPRVSAIPSASVSSSSGGTFSGPHTSRASISPRVGTIGETNAKEEDDENFDAKDVIAQIEKQEAQNFQNRDLVISSITLEGISLAHADYDTVYVAIDMNSRHLEARNCLAREKGSKRRSYNVTANEIALSISDFRERFACVSVLVKSPANSPQLPTQENTIVGESPNSAKIPFKQFYSSTFEVSCKVKIPPLTAGQDGVVTITIQGHAHESKEVRTSRIQSMRPQDLINLKFEPVTLDDDDDEDYEDEDFGDDDQALKTIMRRKSGKALGSPDGLDSSNDLRLLFPAASSGNLLASPND